MYDINRIVTIIKPKQAFLDWLDNLPNFDEKLSLDDIRQDCTALLIPDFDEPAEALEFISEIYLDLFENELDVWSPEEDGQWPQERTFETFTKWFDLEFHSMVVDLVTSEDEEVMEYEFEDEDLEDGDEDMIADEEAYREH